MVGQVPFIMISLLDGLREKEMPSGRAASRFMRAYADILRAYALSSDAVHYLLLMIAVCAAGTAQAQLRGHGGLVRAALPVRLMAALLFPEVSIPSAIQWSLPSNTAQRVLRFHSDAVNAVAFLKDGRFATAGADARIAIWNTENEPEQILEGHLAPIVALSVSPDGSSLASASWDHTVGLWPLAGGAPRVFEGHAQNVERCCVHAGRPCGGQRQATISQSASGRSTTLQHRFP